MTSGRAAWAHRDFNFETPSTDLTATEKTVLKLVAAPMPSNATIIPVAISRRAAAQS